MPPIETFHRHQTAVLWPATGFDGYGQPTVGAAVEIMVRWEATKRQVPDAAGSNIALDAEAVVDRKIKPGSNMWLGKLADYAAGETKFVVKDCVEVPDVKNRHVRRTVGLVRQSDTLPPSS